MLDILAGLRAAAAVLLVGNLLIVCHELGHFLAVDGGLNPRQSGAVAD